MSNEQRQATRNRQGRYANLPECPRCHKRRTVEPAYPVSERGPIREDSPWVGLFLCKSCIKAESQK